MGRNKALMKINGLTMIEAVIAAVPAEKEQIKIVATAPEEYHFMGYEAITDIFPDCGPISGVHAGLADSNVRLNFFLACDLPFITTATISEIIDRHHGQEVLGAKTEDGIQPLCAIYAKSCLPTIETMIHDRSYSLHELFKRVNSEFIEIGAASDFLNVNTPEDLLAAQKKGKSS